MGTTKIFIHHSYVILLRHWLVRYGVTCEIAREGSSGSCKGFFERTSTTKIFRLKIELKMAEDTSDMEKELLNEEEQDQTDEDLSTNERFMELLSKMNDNI